LTTPASWISSIANPLNNFINNNIDEQKLQDGKDNIIGGFALQTASNANILTYLSIIGFYNLPLDVCFSTKFDDTCILDFKHC
jgi:zinc protease